MKQLTLEKELRKHYSLHRNQKIWDINRDSYDFKIRLGEDVLTIKFPKKLIRDIKLKQLLT